MADISAAQVKELRDKTGVGMMACKKALAESGGDLDKAIENLRKRGAMKAAEKADRSTGEGRVAVAGRAIVKILCETDFVAKNEQFVAFCDEIAQKVDTDGIDAATAYFESVKTDKIQAIGENIVLGEMQVLEAGDVFGGYVHSNGKLGAIVALAGGDEEKAKDVAMHEVAMDPSVANPEDVPAEEIEAEKNIYRDQMKNEGKPENIIEKIIEGKVHKFCADRALSSQAFVKDPSQTVAAYLGNGKVAGFIRFSV
jgi:elongation factor Ts